MMWSNSSEIFLLDKPHRRWGRREPYGVNAGHDGGVRWTRYGVRCGGVRWTGVTSGHGRPALSAERTSNVGGLWNEQLLSRPTWKRGGSASGTLYRSADVMDDAGVRDARHNDSKNRDIAKDGIM